MDRNSEGSLPDDRYLAEHKGKSTPVFDFEKLSGKELVVLIRLGNEVYELRKTKTGKLVLNK